ncbi:MAG: redoxin domain-containing protein [Verrucomicrobiales bacterium]
MLTVGETAPDFKITTLGEEGPKHITLSENLGKPTVLLFVPMAFTSVCTKELCSVTGEMSEYESLDAKIIAISGDSPFAQAAWAEKEGIKLTLASDYEHDVAKEYGVAYESFLPEKKSNDGRSS